VPNMQQNEQIFKNKCHGEYCVRHAAPKIRVQFVQRVVAPPLQLLLLRDTESAAAIGFVVKREEEEECRTKLPATMGSKPNPCFRLPIR